MLRRQAAQQPRRCRFRQRSRRRGPSRLQRKTTGLRSVGRSSGQERIRAREFSQQTTNGVGGHERSEKTSATASKRAAQLPTALTCKPLMRNKKPAIHDAGCARGIQDSRTLVEKFKRRKNKTGFSLTESCSSTASRYIYIYMEREREGERERDRQIECV